MRLLWLLALAGLAACAGPSADRADTSPGEPDASVEAPDATGADAAAPDASAPDSGSPDTGVASSRGSGKLACSRTGTFTSTDGTHSYCVATVAGVELKIVEPAAASGPLYLALYFHGDGAKAYVNDTAPRIQVPWTSSHQTLYVAALAPNTCAWWLAPAYTACDGTVGPGDQDLDGENAAAVVEVLKALRAGWDLRDAPVLFGGSSGGSLFLSGSFLPRHGHQYQGAWALGCGGDKPWSGKLDWDAKLRGPNKLFYTYGDADFLLADIQASLAYYQGQGFPVDESVVPGAAHCAFDHIGRATAVWDAFLSQ